MIQAISISNGPAFLSLTMNPRALTSSGFTGPASSTTRPNEVATNVSSGSVTSPHSSSVVVTAARYEKATCDLGT